MKWNCRLGIEDANGGCFTGTQVSAKVGREMGTVEAKGIAVEMDSSSSGNSCRSSSLSCEV